MTPAETAETERDRLAKQLSRAHDDESIERERAERLAARVKELEEALRGIANWPYDTMVRGDPDSTDPIKTRARAALDKEKA